jgi:hypothetical protein
MISSLPLSPPDMKVAQFMDCNEQLIMSFLQGHGIPFKWLFSESWNFYYQSLDSFASSPSMRPRRSNLEAYHQSDLWLNLERFFQVKTIRYNHDSLRSLIADAVRRGTCLYTMGRMHYLPWHVLYGSETNGTHFFVINGINEETNQVHIVDWSPHFVGWVDYETIEAAYLHRNFCYELTPPVLTRLDETVLAAQLRKCLANMKGELTDNYASGLIGLRRMMDDLKSKETDLEFLISIWDRMKDVVETREGFTEFVQSVREDPSLGRMIDDAFYDSLYNAINMWYTFRNGAMKAKMTGKTDISTHLRRLAAIIELENECVLQLERVLNEKYSFRN